jgi:hypothetical protein
MLPKKDPVWAQFTKTEEGGYKETPTDETKTRTKAFCAFGCPVFLYRKLDQLINHLAAPSEGLGKSSCCKYAKSAAPGVQAKYAAELASRAAGKAMKKKTEGHRSSISVRTRDLLPTLALYLLPTAIHPRELPASMNPLLICHAPTLTYACPRSLQCRISGESRPDKEKKLR